MLKWLSNLGKKALLKTEMFFSKIKIMIMGGGAYTPIASMEDSCVAHYKMNDNAATDVVIDSRGYSNGTAQQNTEDIDTTGKVGGALTFNGVDDYVNTNNAFESTFQDSFSINLWCKANDAGNGNYQYLLQVNKSPAGMVVELFMDDSGELTSAYAVNNKVIYATEDTASFIVGVNDWKMITTIATKVNATTGNVAIYVNGILRKLGTTDDEVFADYVSSLKPHLGTQNNNGSATFYWFPGDIDDVMIFNRAINAEEVAVLYNSGRGTESFQLTSNLNLDGSELIMAGV